MANNSQNDCSANGIKSIRSTSNVLTIPAVSAGTTTYRFIQMKFGNEGDTQNTVLNRNKNPCARCRHMKKKVRCSSATSTTNTLQSTAVKVNL